MRFGVALSFMMLYLKTNHFKQDKPMDKIHKYYTARIPDSLVLDRLCKLASSITVSGEPSLRFSGAGPEGLHPNKVDENEVYKELKGRQTVALDEVALLFRTKQPGQNSLSVAVSRDKSGFFDEVQIKKNDSNEHSDSLAFIRLINLTQEEFKEIQIQDIEEFRPDNIVASIQAQRETSIIQLEKLIASATNSLLEGKARLETEVRENTKVELDKIAELKKEMLEDLKRREAEIGERATKLDAEQQQFDKRQSKYLRREIRKEILQDATTFLNENKPRRTAFLLRLPNDALFVVCIVLFFVLFFSGLRDVHDALVANTKANLTFYLIRQSLYFSSSLVFVLLYSRWISAWYKRHADAEDFYKLSSLISIAPIGLSKWRLSGGKVPVKRYPKSYWGP